MTGFTLDAGALIAVERGDHKMIALLDRLANDPEAVLRIPAGALAQALRDPTRQVLLARLLKKASTRVVGLDEQTARVVGMMLGVRGTSDVIDASVVVCARRYRQPVITSDPDDLRRFDSTVQLFAI